MCLLRLLIFTLSIPVGFIAVYAGAMILPEEVVVVFVLFVCFLAISALWGKRNVA